MSGPPEEFTWSAKDEPHASRAEAIRTKYPEIKKLFGPDYRTIPFPFLLVAIQLVAAYFARNLSAPWFLALAYIVGGTVNHSAFLLVHEITHHSAVKSPLGNRILAFISNMPVGIPFAAAFRVYHMEHHRYQGSDIVDTDIPTEFEARVLRGTLGKIIFCTFSLLFYALRPLFTNPKPLTPHHIQNLIAVIGFDIIVGLTLGPWAVAYLLTSTLCSGCLHPMSAHFISEHYVIGKESAGYETFSYYGPMNILAWNVGYHNEHHDFPAIPWTRLPLVRKIAPEFYDNLPQTPSWPGTLWRFITDPSVSLHSRVKRNPRGDAAAAKKSE